MAGSQIEQPQYSLESFAIFRSLSSTTLKRIKRRCSRHRYEPHEPIVGHLDTSDEVFFLLTGRARVAVRSTDSKAVNLGGNGDMPRAPHSWTTPSDLCDMYLSESETRVDELGINCSCCYSVTFAI